MGYWYIRNNKSFVVHCILIFCILVTCNQMLPAEISQLNRPTIDTQRFLENLREHDIASASILMQQSPEILQKLPDDTQIGIIKDLKFHDPDQISSKLEIAAMLMKNKPLLCQNLSEETLGQLCHHATQNPAAHSNLFKALIASFLQTKDTRFYPRFNSLITEKQIHSEKDEAQNIVKAFYSLPKELKEFLLHHQHEIQLNYGTFEAVNSQERFNTQKLLSHPAIKLMENQPPIIHIDRQHVNANFRGRPLLCHIVHYTQPKYCLNLLKAALKSNAPIAPHLKNGATADIPTPADIVAKSDNPSCILFLQQYKAFHPRYNPNIILPSDFHALLSAYQSFMLDDQSHALYDLLKPDIMNPQLLNGTNVQYVRNCFINESLLSSSYPKYYSDVYNKSYLYTQLLPILQKIREEQKQIDGMKTIDTIFFDAIVENKPEIVFDMCQKDYNPNTFYAGSCADHYGSLPLWTSVNRGHHEITKILLKFKALPNLHPCWYPARSIMHFALHSCWHQYCRLHDESQEYADYPKYIETVRIILDHFKYRINIPEPSGKTLLESAVILASQPINQIPSPYVLDETLRRVRQRGQANPLNIKKTHIISLLLELGANPFAKTSNACTLEQLAQSLNSIDIANYIIAYKKAHPQKK